MDEIERDLERALRTIRDDYRKESAPFRAEARSDFLRRYRSRGKRRIAIGSAIAATAVIAIAAVIVLPKVGSKDQVQEQSPTVQRPNGLTIAVKDRPVELAIGDDGLVWVSEASTATIAAIDPATNTVARRVGVGGLPRDIAVGLGAVWVAEPSLGRVAQVNPETGEIDTPVDVATGPVADIELTTGSNYLWAVVKGDDRLVRIEPGGDIKDLQFPGAIDVAVRDRVWVLDDRGNIHVLDPDTLEETTTLHVEPSKIGDITFGNASLWYGTRKDGTLSRIDRDTGEVIGTVHLKGKYSKLAIDTTTAWALSTEGFEGGWLTPIDRGSAKELGSPIILDGDPVEPAIGSGSVWLAETANNLVLRLPKLPSP